MAMKRRKFDVGIVVPLKEEFRYVMEVAPLLESISHQGTYFYRLDFGAISAVCVLVDQMGPLPALQATTRLLEFADVKLVVVLGLGGALDKDVAVGDVVIASEVNEFQANSKAEPAGDGYEVRYSGRHWPLEYRIREAVSHFEFSSDGAFADWQAATSEDYKRLDIPDKERTCSSPASLHLGPIASGSVVGASSAFVEEVKRINRKFLAIDMEAAGVAPAAAERIHPLPCLVVRGISDHANEDKKALEKLAKGSWRRYCVRNATSLLRNLLVWEGFMGAAELGISATPTGAKDIVRELATRLKSCVGGPWIVGVAFGIYEHGPRLLDGKTVVPMDLSRLRVVDSRIGELLDAADKQKETLSAIGQEQATADGFEKLVGDFRKQLNSSDADSLLRDFDRVVMDVLCPEDEDDEVESLLLVSARLEEEVGAEAVIELLRGSVTKSLRVRERYVEALASAKKWTEIAQIVEQVKDEELSRGELEHGLFACANLGLFDRANAMMKQHQVEYDDNAAKLFRREVSRQYPQIGEEASRRKT
jgi:nucleoside phosphorylase